MKKLFTTLFLYLLVLTASSQHVSTINQLRAPAYPLVTVDPYTSAWSFSDKLYSDAVRHWTGKKQTLIGAIRVDGNTYRFMGIEETPLKSVAQTAATEPRSLKTYFDKTAEQESVNVQATQTHYNFTCGPVKLKVTFTSPLLMDNLDILSRPISYITYEVASSDKKTHAVQVYFEASPEWAVNTIDQKISSEKIDAKGLTYLKTGTIDQKVLGRKGDNVRIDWGYFYLVGKQDKTTSYAINDSETTKKEFSEKGKISGKVNKALSPEMEKQMTALAISKEIGKVGPKSITNQIMIGYDDQYSIQYFGDNLRPWWNNDGKKSIANEFVKANQAYSGLIEKCNKFDAKLMADAEKAGGKKYAELCAVAYRQAIAAHKLLKDKNGDILFLSKENFSNGSVNTVDVTYPSAPMFLYYNPDLLKGMLNGIFYFSESGKWKNPFAAHDIGTYPLANGQTYGEGMPVEESGNMLILATAIAQVEGNAKYAEKHWAVLTTWADYLLEKGLDPENQLCTDDFAGHLAHNANLSIKAILGIAGYGKMAGMLGKKDIANKYTTAARVMAQKWITMADDNDHYSLTFDKKGTWSQKYNLVWDKILNLGIFPKEVAQKELAYYLTKQNIYGLPLDSRATYTKGDWIVWTATMAQDKATFEKLINPLYKYVNETTSRVPLSDWHQTITGKQVGFQARSVVGGFFFKLLKEKLNDK